MLPSLSAGTFECCRPQIVFERGLPLSLSLSQNFAVSSGCVCRPEPGPYFDFPKVPFLVNAEVCQFTDNKKPDCSTSGALILSPAIRKQSRLLPQRHDPTWPALHRLIERSPRNPVITGKSDQLLDVRVCVVPKLDRIRKIERPPHSHCAIVNKIGTWSTDSGLNRHGEY